MKKKRGVKVINESLSEEYRGIYISVRWHEMNNFSPLSVKCTYI